MLVTQAGGSSRLGCSSSLLCTLLFKLLKTLTCLNHQATRAILLVILLIVLAIVLPYRTALSKLFYILPWQEDNAVFAMTNMIISPDQKQAKCPCQADWKFLTTIYALISYVNTVHKTCEFGLSKNVIGAAITNVGHPGRWFLTAWLLVFTALYTPVQIAQNVNLLKPPSYAGYTASDTPDCFGHRIAL